MMDGILGLLVLVFMAPAIILALALILTLFTSRASR